MPAPRNLVDSFPMQVYKNLHCLANADIAREIGVSESSIGKWLRDGKMPDYAAKRLSKARKPRPIEEVKK